MDSACIEKANHMVTFILNHGFLRNEFTKQSNKQLCKYSNTRFAYNFLMLGRLSTCSAALRQLFISDEFTTSRFASTVASVKGKEDAKDLDLWDNVRRIDAMVQPVIHVLSLVDGMQPCIRKVYEAMDPMIENLRNLLREQDGTYQLQGEDDSTLKSKYKTHESSLY